MNTFVMGQLTILYMEVTAIQSFLSYYKRVREGTLRLIQVVPEDKLEWTYKPGKFTIGDSIRHIAAIERNLYAEVVQGRPVRYTGCGKELADGLENVLAYFNKMHEESMAIFSAFTDEDLKRKVKTLDGKETTIASFLRALIIHEVHHRGALYNYLSMLDIKTPPIFGLTSEEVIKKGQPQPANT